jgi:hypothetical protein
MDPLSIIVTAVVSGAAEASRDAAVQAVKDAYNDLKELIVRKTGDKADVKEAIGGVERKPNSRSRQGVLREELEIAGVDRDDEVVKQSQALVELLEEQGEALAAYHAEAHGSGAVTARERGVAVGGDIQSGVVIVTSDGSRVGEDRPPQLPARCPHCGVSIRPNEVKWLDEEAIACAYCGSSIRAVG